jgi:hypothetical protein
MTVLDLSYAAELAAIATASVPPFRRNVLTTLNAVNRAMRRRQAPNGSGMGIATFKSRAEGFVRRLHSLHPAFGRHHALGDYGYETQPANA